ncbi:MAG: TfoX/Sxy family protein [Candidatus Thorarchaeota archaeon]
MAKEYLDYIINDVFKDFEGITYKAMFGGYGIYKNQVIFAIIVDGELFFKVGSKNRADFKLYDTHPFIYERKGKKIAMSYWTLPEEIMNDKETLQVWIDRAVEVSLESKKVG